MTQSRDDLKTHYNDGSGHVCGLPKWYKAVNGLNNVPLVTCIRCMRSLLANGGGMLTYRKARRERIRGRWYNFPAQVVPTKRN